MKVKTKENYALGQDASRKVRPWSVVKIISEYQGDMKIRVIATYKTEQAAWVALKKVSK